MLNSGQIQIYYLAGHLVWSDALPSQPCGVLPDGVAYYDYEWKNIKASGMYLAVVRGQAEDGKALKASARFAIVK